MHTDTAGKQQITPSASPNPYRVSPQPQIMDPRPNIHTLNIQPHIQQPQISPPQIQINNPYSLYGLQQKRSQTQLEQQRVPPSSSLVDLDSLPQTTPADLGNDMDDFGDFADFASALPQSTSPPVLKQNEVLILQSNIFIVVEATRMPATSGNRHGAVKLVAKFSNAGASNVHDLEFQMAVPKVCCPPWWCTVYGGIEEWRLMICGRVTGVPFEDGGSKFEVFARGRQGCGHADGVCSGSGESDGSPVEGEVEGGV